MRWMAMTRRAGRQHPPGPTRGCPLPPDRPTSTATQGLTIVHFSAQRKRCLWDRNMKLFNSITLNDLVVAAQIEFESKF